MNYNINNYYFNDYRINDIIEIKDINKQGYITEIISKDVVKIKIYGWKHEFIILASRINKLN